MKRREFGIAIVALLAGAAAMSAATRPIYDEKADPRQLIRSGVAEASRTGKNVVLVFGANWCSDCHALDEQMHRGELAKIIKKDFVVVKIDVGRFDKNLDVGRKYGVPIKHGIPALAVLNSHGKLLYAQDQGQFANAGSMTYEAFLEFFKKWAPKK